MIHLLFDNIVKCSCKQRNVSEAEEIKVDIWLARREGRQKDAMELAKS